MLEIFKRFEFQRLLVVLVSSGFIVFVEKKLLNNLQRWGKFRPSYRILTKNLFKFIEVPKVSP